jgi:hypothetical protein
MTYVMLATARLPAKAGTTATARKLATSIRQLCCGGSFLLHSREQPSPEGLSNIKNPQFQEEKISARKRARSHHINMEKSSKNLISLFGKFPLVCYPTHPPPHRIENPQNLHVEKARLQDADAKSRRGEMGGGGGNNAKQRRIQNEDS